MTEDSLAPATSLDHLLELTEISTDRFVGVSPSRLATAEIGGDDRIGDDQRQRVYGGQVAAQSLAAAVRTVTGRSVHSLHGYFVAGADAYTPIEYVVERIRDGRNLSSRQVRAIQSGKVLFTMTASFGVPGSGVTHQDPMPEARAPEDLAPPVGAEAFAWSGVDLRFVERWSTGGDAAHVARRKVWVRLAQPLASADPVLHACALTYLSDLTLIRTALGPHQEVIRERGMVLASLDHAIWFHRSARADEWLLYSAVSPSAAGSFALAIGNLFSRDGELVATVAQQGLLRVG
jgi:acyl-CoA thioesterase-2